MKRIRAFLLPVLLLMIMLLVSTIAAHAAAMTPAQQVSAVQSLEDTLFTVHYDQDTMDARVGRLETTVFGQPQSGPVNTRIDKLQSVLSPGTLGPLSPVAKSAPATDANKNNQSANASSVTGAQSGAQTARPYATSAPQTASGNTSMAKTAQAQPQSKMSPTPGETDYPTVGQMELKRFGKTYVQDDITVRLTRLEKDVFKTVQNGELADRVDNLRMVVLGDTGGGTSPTAAMAYQDPSGGGGAYYPQSPAYTHYTQVPQNGGYPAYGPNSSSYPQPPNYGPSPYGGTPIASAGQPSYSSSYNGGNNQAGYGYPPANGPNGGYNAMPGPNQGAYPNSAYNAAPAMSADPTPDQVAAISEVEKEVLGHTYPAEPFGARLDRVETKVFHTTSPEMSNEDRMQRVIAVASAGGAPPTARSKAKATFQTLLPIILTILPMVLL